MKILNLYAGIGGNRKLWGEHDITAVELDHAIAEIYQDFFPKDKVVVGDAHEYLLKNYKHFDFIWSSPPCQTHSSFRQNIGVRYRGVKPEYPDMRLYQEILFLEHNATNREKGGIDWVVENVVPYYEPLIVGQKLQRHLFWSNFQIPDKAFPRDVKRTAQIPDLQKLHRFDLSKYKIKEKRQILRNCVSPELGKYILDQVSPQPQ